MPLRGVKRRSNLLKVHKYVIPMEGGALKKHLADGFSERASWRVGKVRQGISLLLLLFLVSCNSKTFDTKEELWTYLKDESNGYVQHKNVNDVDFTLLYKPTDLIVQQELDDSKDAEQISALREKYNKYMYFSLSMSKNNQEVLNIVARDRNKFGKMVNALAFGLGDKVHLYTQQKDTLEIVDFVYPRLYGMSRSTDILFVYPRDEEKLQEENLNFTIEDLGLYTGEVKFKVPTKSINNEPRLKL